MIIATGHNGGIFGEDANPLNLVVNRYVARYPIPELLIRFRRSPAGTHTRDRAFRKGLIRTQRMTYSHPAVDEIMNILPSPLHRDIEVLLLSPGSAPTSDP